MTPPQPSAAPRGDGEHPLGALLAPDILALLEDEPGSVALETEQLHPADLADVAEALPEDRLIAFLTALPPARAADVLEYLDEDRRAFALEGMTTRQAAALVSEMTPDDRADLLEELAEDNEERADEILAEIPEAAREETERLLAYDPASAGGLMTTEFVSAPESMTAEEALRGVRAVARTGRREAMYAIYTTDGQGRLRGVLSLRELLAAPEGARLADVAWTEVQDVRAEATQEEVARLISATTSWRCPWWTPSGGCRRGHGGRRDRRHPGGADRGRAEARRHGGARRAVHERGALQRGAKRVGGCACCSSGRCSPPP
jgi:magnesium transporter